MPRTDELKMDEGERLWWERVRARGALWYVVNKGLLFLVAWPLVGVSLLRWPAEAEILVEGWCIGLFWGAFFYMRKELRYRFTLEIEGRPLPDGWDE